MIAEILSSQSRFFKCLFCEASPHLVFHGFTAKTGLRVKTILQAFQEDLGRLEKPTSPKALFPPAKQAGDRVMTFANRALSWQSEPWLALFCGIC